MAAKPAVTKRKVFYLSGFDPRGAGYYHRLYRDESAKHAALSTAEITTGKRSKDGNHVRWQVDYKNAKHKVATDYSFLVWDDIVRKHWNKTTPRFVFEAIKTYAHYIFTGAFKRGLFTSWPPAFSYIYPFFALLLILAGSIFAGFGIYNFLAPHNQILAIVAAPLFSLSLIYIANRILQKSLAYWMIKLFIFSLKYIRSECGELDERITEFAGIIAREIAENEYDEILIIGHSTGALIINPLLANLLQEFKIDAGKIKVMTLGHCIPLMSFLPEAESFREDLRFLAKTNLHWLDVTAATDNVCFAYTGPFVGICENENKNLKSVSARLHKFYDKERYSKIKKNRFLCHFLYIMSGERITDYNYFEITAAEKTLEARFANIETAIPLDKFKLGRKK
ncbi:MAG: hypothetical protein COV36_02830 [Alphaproteobacteria bacterium CG11_big_fil_rev_8_21_14_0_20_44_7]|nr:MAG: hypothetical protein COV36_02830 [Alphaproteobacteria bacterium CG11_big_fil_rev_8_21_14_0_20_44_7]